jgi:FG-GAP-like repeat
MIFLKMPWIRKARRFVAFTSLAILFVLTACGGGGGGGSSAVTSGGGSFTGGETNPVCLQGVSGGAVQEPLFVRNVNGQTSWFASPMTVDLDGNGTQEIVAAYYTLYVYDHLGNQLDSAAGNGGRIYAPHVVCDLDGDGVVEIVCGQRHEVYVYEWRNGGLQLKSGWPADTTSAGESPEVRGMAAADLDGDGQVEIVVTTTQTQSTADGGAQVFVYDADGSLYQPPGLSFPAWPRYNNLTGEGGDADRNGAGHSGFGCYGLNVGIGDIDDDAEKEIIVTYDNHHIQAFNHDGRAIDASSYFTNRDSNYLNMPLTWGQFIRWADPAVEEAHYNLHTGVWPHPSAQEWLQWTASPPNVVDLNGDGRNEVVGVPNIEMEVPYVTQAYGIMVLEGAYGSGGRSAMRLAGWETLPRGGQPINVDGWYPPAGVPAPTTINIQGDDLPEIVVSLNDGFMYAFGADSGEIWRYNYTHGKAIMFASEAMAADLNQDGSPEIIFTTFGDPDQHDSGNLIILAADGTLLHDLPLPDPGHNGNGNGAPAAPTVSDIDNDGQLEILVQTFDHGMDIFTVPGSGTSCLLWTTARGGPLRSGRPSGL